MTITARSRDDWRRLPRAVYNGENDRPSTYKDTTFFNKTDVKNGTIITHYARRGPPTKWVVYAICTFTNKGANRARSFDVPTFNVRTLYDKIEMHCVETGEWRTMSFTYIVYSAIWRIDNN